MTITLNHENNLVEFIFNKTKTCPRIYVENVLLVYIDIWVWVKYDLVIMKFTKL